MIASSLHTVIIILVMPRSPATVFPSLTAVLNSVEESVCNSGSVCSFPTHLSYKIVGGFLLGLRLELNLRLGMRLGDVWFMINVMSTLTHVDIHMHTYPTELWQSLLDYPHLCWHTLLLGTLGLCVLRGWLASVLCVLGGLESLGLAAAAATDDSHLNSFPILTPGSTQSAASLGHSTTSSWRGNLKAGPVWITIWLLLVMLSWNMNPTQRILLGTCSEVSLPSSVLQELWVPSVMQRFHQGWKSRVFFLVGSQSGEKSTLFTLAYCHCPLFLPLFLPYFCWKI